jgi:hypothetical protein
MSGVLVAEYGRRRIGRSNASLPVRDDDIFKLARFNWQLNISVTGAGWVHAFPRRTV